MRFSAASLPAVLMLVHLSAPLVRAEDTPAGAPAKPPKEGPAYLGVLLAPIPEELRVHLKVDDGAMVQTVQPGSPAEKAGVKTYDVITAVNGEAVRGPEEVKKRVHAAKAGEALKLGLRRGADVINVDVTLAAAPPPIIVPRTERPRDEVRPGFLGVGYSAIPADLAAHLNLTEGTGVLVTDVWKGSPAEKAGIEQKDVISLVDGKEVEGPEGLVRALKGRKAGEELTLDLIHRGEKKTLKVALEARPEDAPGVERRRDRMFWGPGTTRKGKVTLKSPDGREHSLELPGELWSADELFHSFEDRLGDFEKSQVPMFKERLRKGLKELEEKLKAEGVDGDQWSSTRSENATVRSVEGGYDITVRDSNGTRTFTVLKDGKTLAEDQSFDSLEKLPADVQDRVKKAAEMMPSSGKKGPRLPEPKGGDGKLRA